MANFLTKTTAGITRLVAAITASAGAGDADKIIATDAAGLIDASFLPPSIGQTTQEFNAGVNLTAGDFVYISGNDAVLADNTAIGTAAVGFVLDTVLSGNPVLVYFSGVNTAVTATSAETYFLDTAGGFTATPPAFAVGTICQQLGVGIDDGTTNGIVFEYNEPIEFENQ